MGSLRVVSYNLHGFNQGIPLLRQLSGESEIILMQEHWLSSDMLHKIDALLPEFLCFNHSSMDKVCSADILRGRPFGGVSIAVHFSLKHSVKLLVLRCSNFIVINVYMPCRSGRQDYCEVLSYSEVL